jgi:hypothetical protein
VERFDRELVLPDGAGQVRAVVLPLKQVHHGLGTRGAAAPSFFGTLAGSAAIVESRMGMLDSLLGAKSVDAFAKTLAEDVAKRYPPELDKDPSKRPSVNRLTRIVEDACEKAKSFQQEKKLGWYGKAKLGNTFRWELTSMGYQKDFVEMATEALVVYLSRPATGNAR